MSIKLNELLNNAKNESPILSENEVFHLIANQSVPNQKFKKSFKLKFLFYSGVLALLAIIWLFLNKKQNEPLPPKFSIENVKDKQQLNLKNHEIFKTTHKNTSTLKLESKNKLCGNLKPNALELEEAELNGNYINAMPFTPSFNEAYDSDNRDYFDENGYLQLTYEELEKLGIFTDGKTLKYENITDSLNNFMMGKMKIFATTKYKLEIQKNGRIISTFNFNTDSNLLKTSKKVWPAAVNIIDKKDTLLHICESIWSKGYENEFFNEVKNNLIPLKVEITNFTILIWLKGEEKLYEYLSYDIGLAIKNKYPLLNIEKYVETVKKYRSLGTEEAYIKGLNKERILKLQQKFVLLTPEELKELNIFQGEKLKVTASFVDSFDNQFFKTKFKVNKNGTGIQIWERKLPFYLTHKKSAFTIVAISDYQLRFFNYLKLQNAKYHYTAKEKLNAVYFVNHAEKLIPIVAGGRVFWFEPNKKMEDLVKRHHEKVKIEKINSLRLPHLIELNEFELKNLGIKFLPNQVLIPTDSIRYFNNNQGLFFHVFKNNQNTAIILDTSTSNKKSNQTNSFPTPVLVTSINGKKILLYHEKYFKKENATFNSKYHKGFHLNELIPIKINWKGINILAWYEANNLFLNALPLSESIPITNQLGDIKNDQITECKYFEICQNNFRKINFYTVSHNPFSQDLKIELNLDEENYLSFTINDISGETILVLNQNMFQNKGNKTYNLQVENLKDGIYLLIIQTNKGERISHRILKNSSHFK